MNNFIRVTAAAAALFAVACAQEASAAAAAKQPAQEKMVLVRGGTFQMGSPASEPWRSDDETQHTVTVSDFYLSRCEVTQEEYAAVTGLRPGGFSGRDLPVVNVSWLDAVRYCNARSEKEGLTPVYTIEAGTVRWDRGADGYRLPTEAEWEYACRAGTVTPFSTGKSISPEESDYYGHYPYEIESNYFTQEKLAVKPGVYREKPVSVRSFSPNQWGLYNMHGNVSEWVWDYYGPYGFGDQKDPAGPLIGSLRVYRGGGWNDFAKNIRSAYRAALAEDRHSFNLGFRVARSAAAGLSSVITAGIRNQAAPYRPYSRILIAYFSWSGNTRSIAKEIQRQTGGDIFEIAPVHPYSRDYNTVLKEAQRDQRAQARPLLADIVRNMDRYSIVLLGYPNWWASIPMPVATFLESYNFKGKTIIPFCSHGGGRFGQSLTAIAKLVPDAVMGEGLSVHYSGGSALSADVTAWLKANGIQKQSAGTKSSQAPSEAKNKM